MAPYEGKNDVEQIYRELEELYGPYAGDTPMPEGERTRSELLQTLLTRIRHTVIPYLEGLWHEFGILEDRFTPD